MRTGNLVSSRSEHKINKFNNLVNAKVKLQLYKFHFSVSTAPPRVRGYAKAFPSMLCVKLKFWKLKNNNLDPKLMSKS